MTDAIYKNVVEAVRKEIAAFGDPAGMKVYSGMAARTFGTSGTVTSIAGVYSEAAALPARSGRRHLA
ncbi:MAG: hypothetical protein R3C42_00815 [Parvularculaceae bacterium]